MGDQVHILRQEACLLLKERTEGKEELGSRTQSIDAVLKWLRMALYDDDPRSDLYQSRNALAFNLHDVRHVLAETFDLGKTKRRSLMVPSFRSI